MLHLNPVFGVFFFIQQAFFCKSEKLRYPRIKFLLFTVFAELCVAEAGKSPVVRAFDKLVQIVCIRVDPDLILVCELALNCVDLPPERSGIDLVLFENRILHISVDQSFIAIPYHRNNVCHAHRLRCRSSRQ